MINFVFESRIAPVVCGAIAAIAEIIVLGTSAEARPRLTVLYSFCPQGICTAGRPQAPLVMDSHGNLYGTTPNGGASGYGTVFELEHIGHKWRHRVVHDFCTGTGCPGDQTPYASLIRDVNDNLYGLAYAGGSGGGGTLFKLSHSGSGWKYAILYNFCSKTACDDGAGPASAVTYQGASTGAPYDGVSPLYGLTEAGAPQNDGVAYKLTKLSRHAGYKETTLYTFCSLKNCKDGSSPTMPPMIDANGNLFGVTSQGGAGASGVVFEIPAGGGGGEIILHTFCTRSGCPDGAYPVGVTFDANGYLIGTSVSGGTANEGTIFRIIPQGRNSPERVLYSFCAKAACADGYEPGASLTLAPNGEFYGTTLGGGLGNLGVVFRFDGKKERVLYSFCVQNGCPDGDEPAAPVILDAAGNLYGTAQGGGNDSHTGTVFELRL